MAWCVVVRTLIVIWSAPAGLVVLVLGFLVVVLVFGIVGPFMIGWCFQ